MAQNFTVHEKNALMHKPTCEKMSANIWASRNIDRNMHSEFLTLALPKHAQNYASKTAGYHRHILHLPNLVCKDAILKHENVFSSKKHFFFIIISNFSNVRGFLFFFYQKNLIMRPEKTFLKNNTI